MCNLIQHVCEVISGYLLIYVPEITSHPRCILSNANETSLPLKGRYHGIKT